MARASALRLIVTLGAALALALSAASTAAAQSHPLRIGVYDNPPLSKVENGQVAGGLFVELFEQVAEAEGWEYEWVTLDFGEGMALVEKGDLDALLVVAVTEERREQFDFTKSSIWANWGVVAVRDGSPIRSLAQLKGKKIAVLEEDTYYSGSQGVRDLLEGLGIEANYLFLPDYEAALDALDDRAVDAAVVSRVAHRMHRGESGLTQLAVVKPVQLGIAFPRSAHSLRLASAIDAHIPGLIADPAGAYNRTLRELFEAPEPAVQQRIPTWALWALAALAAGVGGLAAVAWGLRRVVRLRTQDLRRALDRMETLFAANPDMQFVLDAEGRMLRFEPSPELAPYVPPEEFLGKTVSEVLPPEASSIIVPALARALDYAGTPVRCSYALPGADGAPRHYDCHMAATTRGEILAIVHDSTEVHELLAELQRERDNLEAEVEARTVELRSAATELRHASAAKSRFLSHVSHELRTPLNSIVGFTETLLAGMAGPLNEEQTRQLEMVRRSGSHLVDLVNEILDLSRIESGRTHVDPSEFTTSDVLADVTAAMGSAASSRGLEFRLDDCDTVTLHTDRRMLRQILLNLTVNAVKFTSEGGVSVECREDRDRVRFHVLDTGPGIPESARASIFDPFTRVGTDEEAVPGGFGLGLSISAGLAETLGGRLELVSSSGRGSEFVLEIPKRFPES